MKDEIPELPADHASFGPAMRKLNPMQRKYVLAVQMLGSSNNKRAALLAGYGDDESKMGLQVAANAGWRLSHDPDVQSAMLEEAGKRMGGLRFRAIEVLREIVEDTRAKPALKMRASLAVLDRTGLPAATEQRMTVTHEVGPQAMILQKIRDMIQANPAMREMLAPPVRLMIEQAEKAEAIDAEFTEIKDPDADLLGDV